MSWETTRTRISWPNRATKYLWDSYAKPSFSNFIAFVEDQLGPYMPRDFVSEEELYKEMHDEFWNNQYLLELLPRGHSKTEFFGVWMTIYLAVFQPVNPFSTFEVVQQLLIAAEGKALKALSNRIKSFFYQNPILLQLKPEGADRNKMVTGWDSSEMNLKNGSVILLRTITGNVRGTHNDRVYADDLLRDAESNDQKIIDIWESAVDGTTTARKALTQITGTPLRFTDITYHLRENDVYAFKRRPAEKDPANKVALAPNLRSWEDLQATKKRIGSVKYSCEYLLDPIDDSYSLIKRDWVKQCFDKNHSRYPHRAHFDEVYLGWDFAFSDRKTADYAAGVVVGRYDSKFWVLEYIRHQGLSGPEQLQLIRELHSTYGFDMIGLEENSIKAISKEIKDMNLPIKLFRTGNVDEKDKKSRSTDGVVAVSKRNLVLRIGTTFEQENIVLPYAEASDKDLMNTLLLELTSFAQEDGKLVEIGTHPDGPIALGYALEVATKSGFIVDWVEKGGGAWF